MTKNNPCLSCKYHDKEPKYNDDICTYGEPNVCIKGKEHEKYKNSTEYKTYLKIILQKIMLEHTGIIDKNRLEQEFKHILLTRGIKP